MPKDLFCDKCGSPEDADEDYDGYILCGFHRTEYDLRSLRDAYKEKRAWVKSCWLSELDKMRKEISRLEILLTKYAPDVASASSAEPLSGLESVPAVGSDTQPRG
jgi:hypothetical protein